MIPVGALCGGVAVVIDVLRATSVMVHALDAGAIAIYPCLEIEDAQQLANTFPINSRVLAGERQGLPIEGFDFGNSPGSFTKATVGGKAVVMTTTNGTKAILAAQEAERILIASFLNLGATLRVLRHETRPIHLIASGTNGLVSWEDTLLAGAIAAGLPRPHGGNDETVAAIAAWAGCQGQPLVEVLGRGMGGRRVTEIGLTADLALAAEIDRFDLVAELDRNPLRVVRSVQTPSI
jgi:2-phosphosulfolactate phosphatase